MGSGMDKMSGKAKQTAGKATNNKRMQAEGKYEEGKGKLKQQFKQGDNSDNNYL